MREKAKGKLPLSISAPDSYLKNKTLIGAAIECFFYGA